MSASAAKALQQSLAADTERGRLEEKLVRHGRLDGGPAGMFRRAKSARPEALRRYGEYMDNRRPDVKVREHPFELTSAKLLVEQTHPESAPASSAESEDDDPQESSDDEWEAFSIPAAPFLLKAYTGLEYTRGESSNTTDGLSMNELLWNICGGDQEVLGNILTALQYCDEEQAQELLHSLCNTHPEVASFLHTLQSSSDIRTHPKFPDVPLKRRVVKPEDEGRWVCDVTDTTAKAGDVLWGNRGKNVDILEKAFEPSSTSKASSSHEVVQVGTVQTAWEPSIPEVNDYVEVIQVLGRDVQGVLGRRGDVIGCATLGVHGGKMSCTVRFKAEGDRPQCDKTFPSEQLRVIFRPVE